jgi:predicted RNA binding protein YcfA (HicA-like mRNA interferase family)
MPRPKILSGADVVRIFALFGFEVASQRGSHIKLRRLLADGTRQTLTVPNHRELDRGTALGI